MATKRTWGVVGFRLPVACLITALVAGLLLGGHGCGSSFSTKVAERRVLANVRPASGDLDRLMRNAHYYTLMGRLNLALKELEEAYQRAPLDPKVVDALARLYQDLGDFNRAQKLYQEALARGSYHDGLHNNLCFSYYLAGQWQAAENCFRQALAKNPQNTAARNNLGLLLVRTGKVEEAHRLWREVEGEALAQGRVKEALDFLGLPEPPAYAQKQPVAPTPAKPEPSRTQPTAQPEKPVTLAAKPEPPKPEPAVRVEPAPKAPATPETPARVAAKPEAPRPETVTPVKTETPATVAARPEPSRPQPAAPPVPAPRPAAQPEKPLTLTAKPEPPKPQPAVRVEPAPKAAATPETPARVAAKPESVQPQPVAPVKAAAKARTQPAAQVKVAAKTEVSRSQPVTFAKKVRAAQKKGAAPAPAKPQPVTPSAAAAPMPQAPPRLTADDLVSNAIEVRNGNGIRHFARQTRALLSEEGFNVASIGNHWDFGATETVILYRPGAEKVAQALNAQWFQTFRIEPSAKLPKDVAIKVVLGHDLAERADLWAPRTRIAAPAKPQPATPGAGAVSASKSPDQPRLTAEELAAWAIEVLNGNGVRDFARQTRALLSLEGFHITRIGNHWDFGAAETVILYRPGAEKVAQALNAQWFQTLRIEASAKLPGDVDIKIILGHDLVAREALWAKWAH